MRKLTVDCCGLRCVLFDVAESLLRDKQTESPKRKLGSKVCAGKGPPKEDLFFYHPRY